MSMWSNIDNGLYCMFMNKVEIMDAVVDELEFNGEYYAEICDDNPVEMIAAACKERGYNFNDLSENDINEIGRRLGWL